MGSSLKASPIVNISASQTELTQEILNQIKWHARNLNSAEQSGDTDHCSNTSSVELFHASAPTHTGRFVITRKQLVAFSMNNGVQGSACGDSALPSQPLRVITQMMITYDAMDR